MKTENSGFEPTREFFDMWLKTYNETFGRLAEIPVLGPAREKYDRTMAGFSNFANFYAIWMDFNSDFQRMFVEAMRRLQEKIAADMNGEITPEKYKEFYNICIETYSATFKEFMSSGDFVSDMGKFMSYFMDFQKYNRQMLEENYLKQMNLPTKTDIDGINKELYLLRKKTKELESQVKELSGKRHSFI